MIWLRQEVYSLAACANLYFAMRRAISACTRSM
jgi:hypothetical protein